MAGRSAFRLVVGCMLLAALTVQTGSTGDQAGQLDASRKLGDAVARSYGTCTWNTTNPPGGDITAFVRYTNYWPALNFSSLPPMVEVTCGGLDKVALGSSMVGFGVRSDINAYSTSGVLCIYSDGTQKLLGTWRYFDNDKKNIYSNVTWEEDARTALWGNTTIASLSMWTSTEKNDVLCDIRLLTADGQYTMNDHEQRESYSSCDVQGIYYKHYPWMCNPCSKEFPNSLKVWECAEATSSLLVDVKALVTAKEGKLYAVSYGFMDVKDFQVNSITYLDLANQAGPLPAYNLGVLWDNQQCTIGGDMTTTLSYTATKKVVVSTADTVFKTVEQSVSAGFKSPLPIPEFGYEEKWTRSETTTKTTSQTYESLIEVSSKSSVTGGDYSTLSYYMWNGTARLPYIADATITDSSGKVAAIRYPGFVDLEGSLSLYSLGGYNQPVLPDSEKESLVTKETWTKTEFHGTPGYPYSLPWAYSVPYLDAKGANPTFKPDTSQICGDAMASGSITKIKALWTALDGDYQPIYILGIRMYTPNGTELCSNFGSMDVPGASQPGQSTWPKYVGEWTLKAGEFITSIYLKSYYSGHIMQVVFNTNAQQSIIIGRDDNNIGVQHSWSGLDLASGVLDGFVFQFVTKTFAWWYMKPAIKVLYGIGPIFLHKYNDIFLELGDMPEIPVELPNAVNTFYFQSLSSANVKVSWTSTTQYDLSETIKESWQWASKVKLGTFVLPKIPFTISAEKKWISGAESQRTDTSSWASKTTMSVILNIVFGTNVPADAMVMGVLKLYEEPVELPYNGNISVTFATGNTMRWPITTGVKAQDGRYAVFQTSLKYHDTTRVTAASQVESIHVNTSSRDSTRMCGPWRIASLLKLKNTNPVKHQALAWYKVTKDDKTWEHVASKFRSSKAVLRSLNSHLVQASKTTRASQLPAMRSMVGKKVLVCTV